MNESNDLVKGIYSTTRPNKEIFLFEDSIEIEHRDLKAAGTAKFIVRLLPKPKFLIKIELQNFPFNLFEIVKGKSLLILTSRSESMEIAIISITGTTKEYKIVAVPYEEPFKLISSKNASKIIFHLLNFPNFLGAKQVVETINGKSHTTSKVILKYADWQIIINPVMNYDKLKRNFDLLRREGGFFITHVGIVRKNNGKVFKISEAQKILDALDVYLSFCTGYFTSTLLAIGFNRKNERVWERWGVRWADAWQSVSSWFDHHQGKLLSEVFPGFFTLWQDESWKKPIEDAIHWYLKSNTESGGTEGSIIMAQAALELLSWVLLTEDTKALSDRGFKRLPADDLIRLFLSSQDIHLEVPDALHELSELARKLNWDGPMAITEVRNFIIHPGKKRLDENNIPYYEVLNLALWYIELALLHLSGHKGIYANRLIGGRYVGEVISVPWVTGKKQ